MSKKIDLTESDINKLVKEVLSEIDLQSLFEGPIYRQPVKPDTTAVPQKPQPKIATQNINKIKKPEPILKPAPISKTVPASKQVPVKKDLNVKPQTKAVGVEKPTGKYDAETSKEKQKLNKVQYQIFNIKMRMGKLSLGDLVRKFTQSVHDFDINVTKNTKDKNKILSYSSPLQGNLTALKGGLESIEAEFNKLENLINSEEI